MPDGDILKYLSKYPGANRAAIVSICVIHASERTLSPAPKMIGVADGLSYLHFNDVVHGDLKGVSIIYHRGFVC